MGSQCYSTQLITGEGIFNTAGTEKFTKNVGLAKLGISYAVVSIMGPQSGGKSTLLNHLFGTNFREMDADKGRGQTTHGIWIAKCDGIEPCTFIMDVEGSDGRERGENDDTAFEKQSALFAVAVSDIVLINMWCHDLGREHGANRPLLKTVFEVMLKLFTSRKTTLMFVIRDKTRTPLEKLESILKEDLQRIWNSVQKPAAHKKTPLSEFFNVEVVALSNFETEEVEFKKQVASLRERFFDSKSPGGLAGDREGGVAGSAFSFSAQEIWKVIKENRDLDLPSHQVLVATVRCEEIAKENFDSFDKSEDWCQLKEFVKTQSISDFGQRLKSIYDSCLSKYDMETAYFDDRVRFEKRKQLEEKIILLVEPASKSMLVHIASETYKNFKEILDETLKNGEGFSAVARFCTESILAQFDSRCAGEPADSFLSKVSKVKVNEANSWENSSITFHTVVLIYELKTVQQNDASFHQENWSESRNNFQHAIDAYIGEIRATKLVKLNASYEEKLSVVLSECVGDLLNKADDLTWTTIRSLVHRQTTTAVSEISKELATFDVDDQTKDNMLSNLEEYARRVVVSKSKEEAGKVLFLMKDRFNIIFSLDSRLMDTDIQKLSETAHEASLKILVVMAAARLEDRADNITTITILDETFFASDTWEQIPLSDTLITPNKCRDYWRQFCEEMKPSVTQAAALQAAAVEAAESHAAALEAAAVEAAERQAAALEAAERQAAELQAALVEAAEHQAAALEAAALEAARRQNDFFEAERQREAEREAKEAEREAKREAKEAEREAKREAERQREAEQRQREAEREDKRREEEHQRESRQRQVAPSLLQTVVNLVEAVVTPPLVPRL